MCIRDSVRDRAETFRRELTELIETDKEAFNKVMESFKLPDGAQKDAAVEQANKEAASVPLTVMQKSLEVLKLVWIVAEKGNVNSITDAGVAGLMAMSAVDGAGYNVRINLGSITDVEFVSSLKKQVAVVSEEARQRATAIRELVESKL